MTPVSWLELYANYGQGFRSIDAALELIGNPGIKPFKIESREVGIQLRFDRFKFSRIIGRPIPRMNPSRPHPDCR